MSLGLSPVSVVMWALLGLFALAALGALNWWTVLTIAVIVIGYGIFDDRPGPP